MCMRKFSYIRHCWFKLLLLPVIGIKKVVLWSKAHQMLDQKNEDEAEEWKVFVLLEPKKQGLKLKEGSEVLYQVLFAINIKFN